MPTGTIKEVKGTREWTGNYGTMVDHTFDIEVDGKVAEVYMTKKPDSPAPQAGETLDFEKVKQDQHGIKIKKIYDTPYTPNGNGNGAGPSGDARQESIERQVAAKCAARVIAATVASGNKPVAAEIMDLTDAFHTAIRGYTVEEPTGNDPLPADTAGLDSTAPQAAAQDDSDIPF